MNTTGRANDHDRQIGPPVDRPPVDRPSADRPTAGERKKILLRLDPAVHDALAGWAGEELRSTNAQIEFLLRRALADAGRLPSEVSRMRRPGRPAAAPDENE